jgi:RimJ/RimL family protein N-acetyltransferase
MIIGTKRREEALAWARARMKLEGPCGPCFTFSKVNDSDEFVAVFVFSDINVYSACIHYAAVPGRHGFSKEFVSQAFFFAFGEIGLSRLTGPTRGSNTLALKIAPKFGFTLEGVMRKAFPDGDDCYIFGYLIEDYLQHKWLKYYNLEKLDDV